MILKYLAALFLGLVDSLRWILGLFRAHFALVTFVVAAGLALLLSPWIERFWICLAIVSELLLILKLSHYDGLPKWLT